MASRTALADPSSRIALVVFVAALAVVFVPLFREVGGLRSLLRGA